MRRNSPERSNISQPIAIAVQFIAQLMIGPVLISWTAYRIATSRLSSWLKDETALKKREKTRTF
jgi:hypothetical protein